jgi:hypothetical protein
MKLTFRLACTLIAIAAFCCPALAQWQVPNNSVPVGRGQGTGFKSVGPCATGEVFVGNGPSSPPSCQSIDSIAGGISVKAYGASGSDQRTTGSITSGTNTLTLGSAIDFENGQGITVIGAGGAMPHATPTGVGVTVTGVTGSTVYRYRVATLSYDGGISVAAAEVVVSNGNANLYGGDNIVSVTSGTASRFRIKVGAPHGLTTGQPVFIEQATGVSINGTWTVTVVDDYTYELDGTTYSGTYGGFGVSGRSGNRLTWTGNTNMGYAVWRSVDGGAYTLLGFTGVAGYFDQGSSAGIISFGGSDTYQNYPIGFYGYVRPWWVPDTPTNAIQREWLITTITGGAGTTSLTLAANAQATVSGVQVQHDDTAAFQAAAIAAAGKTMIIPEGWYRVSDTTNITTDYSSVVGVDMPVIEQVRYATPPFSVQPSTSSADRKTTGVGTVNYVTMANMRCYNFNPRKLPSAVNSRGQPLQLKIFSDDAKVWGGACISAVATSYSSFQNIAGHMFYNTLALMGERRAQNVGTATIGLQSTFTMPAGVDRDLAAACNLGNGGALQFTTGVAAPAPGGKGLGTRLLITGYDSGTGVVTFDGPVDITSAAPNYNYVCPGFSVFNTVSNFYDRYGFAGTYFISQDHLRFNDISGRDTIRGEPMLAGSPHLVYGSGDGYVLTNGSVFFNGVYGYNMDAQVLKVRANDIIMNNVVGEYLKFGLAVEFGVGATPNGNCSLNGIVMRQMGGMAFDFQTGISTGSREAFGINLIDQQNCSVNGAQVSISERYQGLSQRFSAVEVSNFEEDSNNIDINDVQLVVNTANNQGFGVWNNFKGIGTAKYASNINVRGLTIRNNGGPPVQAIYFAGGDNHTAMPPIIYDPFVGSGGVRNALTIGSGVSGVVARLDPKLYPYGYAVTDLGSSNIITYGGYYDSGTNWLNALGVNSSTGLVTVPGLATIANLNVGNTLAVPSGVSLFGAGTLANPSISFWAEPTAGLYRIGSNNIGFGVAGANVATFTGTGLNVLSLTSAGNVNVTGDLAVATNPAFFSDGTATDPGITFWNEATSGLYRAGANNVRFVIDGTTILNMDSVGTSLTVPSLATTGNLNVGGAALAVPSGVALMGAGTVSAPGIAFWNENNSGLYLVGTHSIGVSVNSTSTLIIEPELLTLAGSMVGTVTWTATAGVKTQYTMTGNAAPSGASTAFYNPLYVTLNSSTANAISALVGINNIVNHAATGGVTAINGFSNAVNITGSTAGDVNGGVNTVTASVSGSSSISGNGYGMQNSVVMSNSTSAANITGSYNLLSLGTSVTINTLARGTWIRSIVGASSTIPSLYGISIDTSNAGTITNWSGLRISAITGAGTISTNRRPLDILDTGTSVFAGPITMAGMNLTRLAFSATAATIASGFCTTPSISANGSAAGRITIGTACAGSTGVITLPTATTGWTCSANDITNPASNVISQTASSTTSATFTNYARTTGVASNWTDSANINFHCTAY